MDEQFLTIENGRLVWLYDDPKTKKKKSVAVQAIYLPYNENAESGKRWQYTPYKTGTPAQWGQRITILNGMIANGQYGELRSLLKKHYGLSDSSTGKDDEFWVAFDAAINATSVFNFGRRGSKAPFLSVLDYLKQKKEDTGDGTGGYTGPTSQTYITGKPAAKDKFRDIVNQLTGKSPNKEDFEEFYDLLVKAQKRYVNKQSGQHHQTVIQNPFDLDNFTLRYVVKKLSLTDDMSGTAGAVQDLIEQTIRDYGLNNLVGAGTKAKLIKGLLKGKLQESDIDDTFRNLAKATYSAFADDLDRNPNISFQDIISPYVQMYNNMLEKTGLDTDISKVLSMATQDGKKMTIGDFQKALMKSQEYQTTSRAKSDASTLAASFARAFGVNV